MSRFMKTFSWVESPFYPQPTRAVKFVLVLWRLASSAERQDRWPGTIGTPSKINEEAPPENLPLLRMHAPLEESEDGRQE